MPLQIHGQLSKLSGPPHSHRRCGQSLAAGATKWRDGSDRARRRDFLRRLNAQESLTNRVLFAADDACPHLALARAFLSLGRRLRSGGAMILTRAIFDLEIKHQTSNIRENCSRILRRARHLDYSRLAETK